MRFNVDWEEGEVDELPRIVTSPPRKQTTDT